MRSLMLASTDLGSARQRRRLALLILFGVVIVGLLVVFLPAEAWQHTNWNAGRYAKPAASTGLSRGFHFDRMTSGSGGRFTSYICYFQTSSNLYRICLMRDAEP